MKGTVTDRLVKFFVAVVLRSFHVVFLVIVVVAGLWLFCLLLGFDVMILTWSFLLVLHCHVVVVIIDVLVTFLLV